MSLLLLIPTLIVSTIVMSGCGDPADADAETSGPLTVYSGRNERLIGPLLERFTSRTGIDVEVRYGSTAEMAATLLEEGAATPADVFVSQDAAALGKLASASLLHALPADVTARVAPAYRAPDDRWVGLSGRARVVVYNTGLIDVGELPRNLDDVGDARYKGRFGLAPGNASFQAHMAVFAALNGDAASRSLLASVVANEPVRYSGNGAIVDAVIAGEIEWGLVNHYYLWRALRENPEAPARNYFMRAGDGSAFVNMAGAGVLSDDPRAVELVRFMLTDESQRYFAEETYEYPLVPGIAPAVELPSLDTLGVSAVDYGAVARALEPTLMRIEESGLNRF